MGGSCENCDLSNSRTPGASGSNLGDGQECPLRPISGSRQSAALCWCGFRGGIGSRKTRLLWEAARASCSPLSSAACLLACRPAFRLGKSGSVTIAYCEPVDDLGDLVGPTPLISMNRRAMWPILMRRCLSAPCPGRLGRSRVRRLFAPTGRRLPQRPARSLPPL